MVDYFRLVSDELLIKLNQTKQFIRKHNSTIGILTEEILRAFLKTHLPKSVSVEQGFILSQSGVFRNNVTYLFMIPIILLLFTESMILLLFQLILY